jgi:Hypothetical glycosyl hydrolase family 15
MTTPSTSALRQWLCPFAVVILACLSVLVGIAITACGTTAHRPTLTGIPPSSTVTRSFPGTGSNIHVGLAFDYDVHDAAALSPSVDYIWGGYSVDGNVDIHRVVPHIDGYLPFNFDAYPQNVPGHSLSDWLRREPDWIVYRCDAKTPAYYGIAGGNVPLDVTNPRVVRYQLSQVGQLFAKGANGVDFDVFGFTNISGACGVYERGVWKPLGYPPTGQDNARLDDDALHWLRTMSRAIRWRFPGKTISLNLNLVDAGARLREIAPYVDMIFDESGFTSYGSQNLSGAAWKMEFEDLEYLDRVGKAFDVNGIVPAADDQSVTENQINWVLANYLLVKGAHSYTYIYAGNDSSAGTSPSGYGTFYDRPQYHIPIGQPRTGAVNSQGVVMRYYSHGLAIVNPSAGETFRVSLGKPYRDTFGHVYTAVTLAPASGIVLLTEN